jgi:hypothetical protein
MSLYDFYFWRWRIPMRVAFGKYFSCSRTQARLCVGLLVSALVLSAIGWANPSFVQSAKGRIGTVRHLLASTMTAFQTPGVGVASFTPTCGTAGTLVTVTGSGFTGARQVVFGSRSATFTVDSDTQIRAIFPGSDFPSSAGDSITVVTPQGSATSRQPFQDGSTNQWIAVGPFSVPILAIATDPTNPRVAYASVEDLREEIPSTRRQSGGKSAKTSGASSPSGATRNDIPGVGGVYKTVETRTSSTPARPETYKTSIKALTAARPGFRWRWASRKRSFRSTCCWSSRRA